jgi:PKD domain
VKRSLRGLIGCAVIALLAGLLVSVTTSPAAADGSTSYVYSRSSQTFNALPSGSGGGDAGAYEYKYQDECVGMSDAASPFEDYPDDGHTCAALAGNYQCPTPDGGSNGNVAWRRPAGSGGAGARVSGVFCLDDAELVIPLATVITDLRAELLRKLHTPVMQIRPDVSTFVNLPNVMWVEGNADNDIVTLDVPAPLTGQVWAKASYAWDFGDGSAGAAGRGNPFEPGVLPVDDPGHYSVEHTYTQPGTYTVGVVQSWEVFVDIPTYPGGDLDINAPDEPQTAPITVVPSDAVNISPASLDPEHH